MKFSPIAKRLDKIAEANGIDPKHLPGRPELLKGTGVDPEDIDAALINEARLYGRTRLVAIATRYGATVAH